MFKQMKKTLKNQKGLTLIELLAVIVILGIIAAIAVPSIGGIINKTKKDAQVAEGIQIINAAKLYITTNPTATTISTSDLSQYLDNPKDTDFSVKVAQTSGKYKYTLVDHEASTIVTNDAADGANTVTEAELRTYTNAN
ncbi:type II secretion system protein [Mesobacillus subterraneus]|uniref:type II secretion system protein n=1 Tax=Mesobacillus subterraneus TaxID=285983 RepID=UPI001CFF22A3|nr:type II secretion system protein [Mesobacillus subterraneus]WLR56186.1 type II secretion system protein [Mesobacillus subterraneus]